MAYSHTIYNSIDEVDPSEWSQLRRGAADPFMDPRFVRAVEKSMSQTGRFWHLVFRDAAGKPVATVCIASYRVDATLLADGFAKTVAQGAKRIAPWALSFNVLFCGLPVSAGQSHLRFAPDVDTAEILRTLDGVLMKLARQVRAKCIVYKEFTTAEGERLGTLAELGYLRADSLGMNHAEPGFDSFADFLSHLKASKRYTIRRSQKKFDKAGLRVVQMTGQDGVDAIFTEDVHKLYDAVLEKAEVKLERLPAEFFRELARQVPDGSAFTFIYQGERIVAFAASLFSADVYHQMFVGVDYQLNPEYDLYFNLFFHAVDYGYKQHVKDVYVGQSADTFKQRKLGCYQVPLYFYIKGVDWLTALVIRKGFKTLFPSRKPPAAEEEEGEGVPEASGAS